jgi:hypothetical protein
MPVLHMAKGMGLQDQITRMQITQASMSANAM